MTGFGKKVLGDEAYARQLAAKQDRKRRGRGLGKRVTGGLVKPTPKVEELDAEIDETEELEEGSESENPETDTGNAEGGEGDEGDEDGAEDGDEAEGQKPVPTLSIAELNRALKENDSVEFFDKAFAAELERPEGAPRRGALKLLLEAEKRRETPRAPIVKELNAALKAG